MSKIKALEKLRECANHESDGWFKNLEQAFGLTRYKFEWTRKVDA